MASDILVTFPKEVEILNEFDIASANNNNSIRSVSRADDPIHLPGWSLLHSLSTQHD
jgi:hypothetical protein